jgi:hypothetical protein
VFSASSFIWYQPVHPVAPAIAPDLRARDAMPIEQRGRVALGVALGSCSGRALGRSVARSSPIVICSADRCCVCAMAHRGTHGVRRRAERLTWNPGQMVGVAESRHQDRRSRDCAVASRNRPSASHDRLSGIERWACDRSVAVHVDHVVRGGSSSHSRRIDRWPCESAAVPGTSQPPRRRSPRSPAQPDERLERFHHGQTQGAAGLGAEPVAVAFDPGAVGFSELPSRSVGEWRSLSRRQGRDRHGGAPIP